MTRLQMTKTRVLWTLVSPGIVCAGVHQLEHLLRHDGNMPPGVSVVKGITKAQAPT